LDGQVFRATAINLNKYTLLCFTFILFSLFLTPVARYNVIPQASAKNSATVTTAPKPRVYSQAEIDELTQNTFHPYILRTLIKCESQNTNIARMDSNGLMSYGLLQFNGTATWNTYAPLAGVISSTPMNPTSAIKVADYMLSVGQLHRWTCARIEHLV
jgi:hypothetical protein